ncbi:MAG: hypothetical protein AB1467_00330 [Candidatus Diapherotrites archaeon]
MEKKFFLESACYNEGLRQVAVKFSNNENSELVRHKFFPYFYVPVNSKKEFLLLNELLRAFGTKKLKLQKIKGENFLVKAVSFSALKEFHSLLCASTSLRPLLPKPERQFLIEKDWSYFDSFTLIESNAEKVNEFCFPEIELDFLPSKLKEFVSGLLLSDNTAAKKLLESIALSNLLCLHVTELPKNENEITDALLEKIYFKNGIAFNERKNLFFGNEFEKKKFYESKSIKCELDFSHVLSTLLCFPFFNASIDSMDCDCCRPESLEAKNLSPSSLIEVKFLSDGFYFESMNPYYSSAIHNCLEGKQKRMKLKQEWFLNSIPLGPFYRNQVLRVSLCDISPLIHKNQAVIMQDHELHWFCRSKESFLSKELFELNNSIVQTERRINESEAEKAMKSSLSAFTELEYSAEFNYLKVFNSKAKHLFEGIPKNLASKNSKFFSLDLAEAIECIKNQTLQKFRELTVQKGVKIFNSQNIKTVVSSPVPLLLAKEFAEKEKLPLPEIK